MAKFFEPFSITGNSHSPNQTNASVPGKPGHVTINHIGTDNQRGTDSAGNEYVRGGWNSWYSNGNKKK